MPTIDVRQAVTAANDARARDLRGRFARLGILTLNLIASPGAGKTALLEQTIRRLGGEMVIKMVEGDPYTHLDRDRVRQAGAEAVQVNTRGGCHLESASFWNGTRGTSTWMSMRSSSGPDSRFWHLLTSPGLHVHARSASPA